MKHWLKIDGKLIEELKMAGRWLKEALGRHFDGSWEASKGYGCERLQMKIGQERAKETPMSAQGRPNARPRRPNRSPEAPQMVQNRCQNVSGIDDQIR